MDRDIDIRTPESIEFNYELAGLGSRFLALVVDQVIQIAVLLGIFFAIVAAASRLPEGRAVAASAEAEKIGGAILVALVVIVVFTILFGYFIAFEALWNGQTPGKKLLGIRVVRDGGYPVDFGAALIRNLIRVGELALGYYLLAALSTVLSPENKRLGDYAAGTIVVRDAKLGLARRRDALMPPEYAPTLYLSGEERALIKRFLERRDVLDPSKRRELAAKLAERVRDRLSPELRRLDPESLLERL
ncbi:MAG: RDD family protein [Candidatus Eremiobacteraeota bacterium]|nr:RDD family protein [Candidatus Eremiobacteraeota bacterium]